MSYIGSKSRVSTLNSTTTLLTAGSTYTGTWEEVTDFESLILAVKTDQNGTYTVQYSPDGTNIDSTLTRYYRTDQIEAPHRFTNTRKYARVTFTNTSASNQTYLRLQTSFGPREGLNAPIDATLAQDYDAIVTRPTDYRIEIALGRRQGAVLWNKFGYNNDVSIGTEVIASFGGTFTPLITASTLSIVSTSTNDTNSAGTGCRQIVIVGVDANRDEQTEIVNMNGTTPVVTSTTWFGINRMTTYLAGTGLVNAGTITATAVTGSTIQATMPSGEGVTQQCIFFTHQKTKALADWLLVNTLKQAGGVNPVVTIKGWVYSAVSNGKYEVFRLGVDTSVENTVELAPSHSFVIGEKSCFWLEITTDKNATQVSGRFSLIEIHDVDS